MVCPGGGSSIEAAAAVTMAPDGFQDLVQQAQQGDRAAMDEVLAVIQPQLEPLARPFVDPARPAESTSDLLQESCLRAWNKIDSFDGGEDDEQTFRMFRAWIGQIVKRLGLTAKRDRERQKRQAPGKVGRIDPNPTTLSGDGHGVDPLSTEPSPSAIVSGSEREDIVNEVLERVADDVDAQFIRLRYLDGLALSEIATRLDLTFDQARHRYRTLMARLEQELKGLE